MIRPGAIVFRIMHVPKLRHEYLIGDGAEPEWGSDRAAAVFFETHAEADKRATELRTPECWVASIVVEREHEEPELPREILEHEARAPRRRRISGPRPEVKLFGYANA